MVRSSIVKVSEKLNEGASRQKIGTEVCEGHPTVLYEVTKKQGGQVEVYYQ